MSSSLSLPHFPPSQPSPAQSAPVRRLGAALADTSSAALDSPGSWLTWGAVALSGVGLAAAAYLAWGNTDVERKERHIRFRVRKLILKRFASEGKHIIKLVSKAPWCHFTEAEIAAVYECFLSMLPPGQKEVGRITRTDFAKIYRNLGVHNERVIESLFRVWDINVDGHVDFYELLQGLDTLCFASGAENLERFFDSFDVDRSGYLDLEEAELMFETFLWGAAPDKVKRVAHNFFQQADTSHDNRVDRQEFVRILRVDGLSIPGSREFNAAFAAQWGLDMDAIHKRSERLMEEQG